MQITRVSDLDLPEGVFYGVVTFGDGEKVVYEIREAGNGTEALEGLREHAATDARFGVLKDGSSPISNAQLTL